MTDRRRIGEGGLQRRTSGRRARDSWGGRERGGDQGQGWPGDGRSGTKESPQSAVL